MTHEEKKAIIEECLAKGMTTKEIGRRLNGISKQRVYQLMLQYGLSTVERRKAGYWKDQSVEMKWLNRTLTSKSVGTEQRMVLLSHLEDKMPTKCPILGIPLVYGAEGMRTDNSASIDKLEPSKGYVEGNVNIISWRANRIKNDGTLEELSKIVAWLQQKKD
jgi:hypothetical protein